MLGKSIFGIATVCFLASLGVDTIAITDNRSLSGIETFMYTLRYGTAGVFGAYSVSNFVIHFVALVAAAANFVFVFWAMLVFSPTRITQLKWFWWLSLLFLLAAVYTGVQAVLDDRVGLEAGYALWIAALVLMLIAPVVSRMERRRKKLQEHTEAVQQEPQAKPAKKDAEKNEPEAVA
jgi:hypothetical protein